MAKKKATKKAKKKKTRFECRCSLAKEIYLAGDFNDWSDHELLMNQTETGEWVIDIALSPGRYEYKFIVDGTWTTDPGKPNAAMVPETHVMNSHGTYNRYVQVR